MLKTIEKENYIKAVYKMQEKNQRVTVSYLSNQFNVSKSTVSNMIKKLRIMNLIGSNPYKPINLTKSGKQAAMKIVTKHRLIELYLVKKMYFDRDEVHEIAEEIEHIKNTKFFIKIQQILGEAKLDPHGSKIPKFNFNTKTQF